MVPAILHILNAYDPRDKGKLYCKDSIKLVICGTAPLHTEVRKKFSEKYAVNIFENYGLSKTLFLTAQND